QNPWCKKAKGKLIQHMPLVLYCNDLLSNISKPWNKRITFYFTSAGISCIYVSSACACSLTKY
ncbi:hypothetical protein DFH28DRAFT_881049, partial [Melampsora americana]